MSKTSSNVARSVLNRLVLACRDEVVILDGSAAAVAGVESKARLLRQSRRRLAFRRDIAAGIEALGGRPVESGSYGVQVASALRGVRRFFTGPHEGDAYSACAKATAKTVRAYSNALGADLPPDVRFGLERQYTEIQLDHDELRRLRWGASPRPVAGDGHETLRAKVADEVALETWSDEGGASVPPLAIAGAGLRPIRS